MTVQVLVKLKRNEGLSWDGQKIIAAITATPAKGAANRKLEYVIARWLDIAPNLVAVQKGTTSRHKTLSIEIEQDDFNEALERVPEPPKQLRISKSKR